MKHSLWEGGVRGAAFVWSPLLSGGGGGGGGGARVSRHMMAVQDWLPTLYSAAGGEGAKDLPPNLDGVDMWNAIKVGGQESPR